MKKYFIVISTLVLGVLGTACSPVDINLYQDNSPTLKVKTFFNGTLEANGIVKNRRGEVTRYFNATIDASWKDGVGTLDETFVFSDGETQHRIWQLKEVDENTYTASANDVVGSSTLRTAGNALFLQYVLQVPYKDSIINLKVDDKMYLVNDTSLINESIMTKFGFEVAYVTLYIRKLYP